MAYVWETVISIKLKLIILTRFFPTNLTNFYAQVIRQMFDLTEDFCSTNRRKLLLKTVGISI